MTVADSAEVHAMLNRLRQMAKPNPQIKDDVIRVDVLSVTLKAAADLIERLVAQGQPGCGEPVAFVPLSVDGRPQWAETFAADDGCYIDYPEKWRPLYATSQPDDNVYSSIDRGELVAMLQDLASVNLSREAKERQAARMAGALIAKGIGGGVYAAQGSAAK